MTKDDFFGTSNIEKLVTNRKIYNNNEKVSWLNTRVIKLSKEYPFSIFMKYTNKNDEEYKEINIKKLTKGRPSGHNLLAPKLFKLYPNGKTISAKKLADIKSLMIFIPNDAKYFYKDLNGADFEDDIEGYGEVIDFEVEREHGSNT